MEKFSQFGVEPVLLSAQIINFIILIYLLKRFLYKPILAMLKKREEKIRQGLADAAANEELLAKTQEKEKKILAEANEEASVLVAESRTRGAKLEENMALLAKEKSEQVLARAQSQIEEERRLMEKALERKTADAAINILEKLLPKLLSKEDHVRILESGEKLLKRAQAA